MQHGLFRYTHHDVSRAYVLQRCSYEISITRHVVLDANMHVYVGVFCSPSVY
jgi:hypothetical protein